MGYIDNALAIADSGDLVSVFRLNMVRMMIEHRGITPRELASVMGVGVTYVTRIYNGSNYFTSKNFDALLDRLEEAITIVTDSREEMCHCSDSTLLDLRSRLKEGL